MLIIGWSFCIYLSKCSSIGLDVILVDLREPCSYLKASASVPLFFLRMAHLVCSSKQMLVSLHKHYGYTYHHNYCMWVLTVGRSWSQTLVLTVSTVNSIQYDLLLTYLLFTFSQKTLLFPPCHTWVKLFCTKWWKKPSTWKTLQSSCFDHYLVSFFTLNVVEIFSTLISHNDCHT